MSDLNTDENLGNPWLAIIIGICLMAAAWYLFFKMGTNPGLIGKAAVANTGIGRKIMGGLIGFVGFAFLFLGVAKLRSDD